MSAQYDEAIDNAIEHEKDPLSKILYRSHKARTEMKLQQALRLNTDYLEQRPNDQLAQVIHITLLSELDMRDEIPKVAAIFDERDGYDMYVMINSINQLLFTGNNEALREQVDKALERMGDNPDIIYQAHRGLLWLGDIDGASKVVPIIQASYMPEDSRYLVALRQACAENRVADAQRLFTNASEIIIDNPSIAWLSHLILGNKEETIDALREYDARGDMTTMTSFLTYGTFDARPYPNLMALLESERIERGEPIKPPYQCKR
jgi:tetratricopeptide (TPR) repeat protein